MANTSTIHIKTDFDCIVYDFGQEIGTTKADTYTNFELRKGEHELTFVYTNLERISKTVTYIVKDVDCDYRLIVEMIKTICDKAKQLFDSKDYCFALALFFVAAEKGCTEAQIAFGKCFHFGKGVEKNYDNAIYWYTKATLKGNAEASYYLGRCYCEKKQNDKIHVCYEKQHWNLRYDSEKNPDRIQAFKHFQISVDKGYLEANVCLGCCYRNGYGTPIDLNKAIELTSDAAQKGCLRATEAMQIYYSKGLGVAKDLDKAKFWFEKSKNAKSNTIIPECLEFRKLLRVEIDMSMFDDDSENFEDDTNSIETDRVYYLIFDTETTGIPKDYNEPTSNSSNWPRLVQLSWIITDEECNVLSQNDFIIYPEGFTIPSDAAKLHGITTDIAKEKGKPLKEVLEKFMEDFKAAKIIVGHNIAFDKKIVGAELIRLGQKDIMNSKKSLCTMEAGTDFCKIRGYYGYKWPKLQELHKKLFGYEFEDAHNSMSDVTATLKCFKEMKKLGWI